MRVVFMGTPEAAVPSLRALHDAFEVVAVYTRPDRPRGRGLHVAASAVKETATELSIEVRQPKRLTGEADALRSLEPEVIAVVAYGALLPSDVLDVPPFGCVNVHFSLLPRWRGAAPVERSILAGDEHTGVTTMLMSEGLDTGPILAQQRVAIEPDDTSGTLRGRMATLGAPLLVKTLEDLHHGRVTARPQDDERATYADKVETAEAELDPAEAADVSARKVRAFNPTPGAFVEFRGKRLKILKAIVEPGDGEVGAIVDGALQTGRGRLRLLEVQLEGKRRMSGEEFLRGHRV